MQWGIILVIVLTLPCFVEWGGKPWGESRRGVVTRVWRGVTWLRVCRVVVWGCLLLGWGMVGREGGCSGWYDSVLVSVVNGGFYGCWWGWVYHRRVG